MAIDGDSVNGNSQNLSRELSGQAIGDDDDHRGSSEEIVESRIEIDSKKIEDDPLLQQIDSLRFNLNEIYDNIIKDDQEPNDGNKRRKRRKRRVKLDPPPPVRTKPIEYDMDKIDFVLGEVNLEILREKYDHK